MTSDQFWSLFAMPIGFLVCFGPAVLAWLWSGPNQPAPQEPPEKS